ncbi:SOS response-associated peptidase family protein [Rhizobium rhizogenes]|uniref:SOS response-associated peptidase family protein n=1 Tax=Rhizobium rhizogenes TaxID=359 RepID=UPI001F20A0A0
MVDSIGNLEPELDIYPDRFGPIVRNTPAGRELVKVRWGLPSSKEALFQAAKKRADKIRAKGKDVDFDGLLRMEPDGGTTNVRNLASKHWKRWFGEENRCVVPFTRFAEPDYRDTGGGRVPNAWFAGGADEPLLFFAGIWVPQWTSVRKIKEGEITIDLYGFLTTDANDYMKPIHKKAMPVILRNQDEVETWLTSPWDEASKLAKPLPNDALVLLPSDKTE